MCVIVVKLNNNGKPNYEKSRIIVLGNFEARYYSKDLSATPQS